MIMHFDTYVTKHGESLVQQIVDTWERYNSVRHPRLMSLEERWEHFIGATNNYQASISSTAAPTAH